MKNNLEKKLVGTIFLLVFCITSFFGGWTSSKVWANGELTLEAEYAIIGGGSVSDNYVELDGQEGSYIEWSFNMSNAEEANTEWYFQTSNKVKFNLTVNGSSAGGSKSFDVGKTKTSRGIDYPSGNVKLKIEVREDADGPIKIDKVVIKSRYATGNDNNNDPVDPVNGDIIVSSANELEEAISSIQAGNTIYLKAGTYIFSKSLVIQEDNNGRSGAMKKIVAYGDGTPIIDFSPMAEDSSNRGVVLAGDYWYFKGIIIQEAGDNGMLLAGNDNIIEECVFRYNRDSGLQLSRYNTSHNSISQWPSNNLILNSESHDNCDSDNEDADGFAPKLTVGEGNIFRGCVSHHNIDDGWDLYAKFSTGLIGVVTLEDCIAHSNGTLSNGTTSGNGDKNGFKLGSKGIYVDHIVRRCIAFNNGKHGFTDNGNTGSIKFINNTAYNNGDYNFHTRDGASHVFINNISFAGGHTDRIVGDTSAPNALTEDDIYWYYTADESDFVTLTPGIDSDPTSNGFLHLKSGSDLVDVGVVANGIEYNGSVPDLGAIESD